MRYEKNELELMLNSVHTDLRPVSAVADPWNESPGELFKSITRAGVVQLLRFRPGVNVDGKAIYRRSRILAEEQPETPAKIRARMAGDENGSGSGVNLRF